MKPHKTSDLKEHFTELRKRLLGSLMVTGICFLLCWFFSSSLLNIIRQPIEPFLKTTKGGFIFTAPLDQFLAHLHLALGAGFFLSSPYWLTQAWLFISPGLYKTEKKHFFILLLTSSLLFWTGVVFATYIVFPLVFRLLLPFGESPDQAFITIKNYLSFFMRSTFVFGLVFEMPVILWALCHTGVLSPATLKAYRKHSLVALALLSAFLTPPDILSQILLFVPLAALYELSIQLTSFLHKPKN